MSDPRDYDSTDPKRVGVGKDTRQQYRELTPMEAVEMAAFKDIGQAFIHRCRQLSDNNYKPEVKREFALAITHMEDAVMRAVRGITG